MKGGYLKNPLVIIIGILLLIIIIVIIYNYFHKKSKNIERFYWVPAKDGEVFDDDDPDEKAKKDAAPAADPDPDADAAPAADPDPDADAAPPPAAAPTTTTTTTTTTPPPTDDMIKQSLNQACHEKCVEPRATITAKAKCLEVKLPLTRGNITGTCQCEWSQLIPPGSCRARKMFDVPDPPTGFVGFFTAGI